MTEPIAISHSEHIAPLVRQRNEVDEAIAIIMADIEQELRDAIGAFPSFNSAHEGYAVIAEELDELWDEVKANKNGTESVDMLRSADMRNEATQVAAMAARFILNVVMRYGR